MEATEVEKEVLCFILDSSKPLWKGELADCGIVLGTNGLRDLGFEITQTNGAANPYVMGEEEKSVTTDPPVETSSIGTPPSVMEV